MNDINDTRVWQRVVERLVSMTSAGELDWEDWSDKTHRPNATSPLYVAEYKQWDILIYRTKEKYYYDEDVFEWQFDVSMEIVEDSGAIKWTLPKVPARNQLIDYIEYKRAHVDQLVNDLLNS
ncbi:MAG: hypothetical protein K2Y37_04365 [Pirellulales bacterium]|nr:hypothetical protein [Pirellulales bacterium]